jgi:hypothetical protein
MAEHLTHHAHSEQPRVRINEKPDTREIPTRNEGASGGGGAAPAGEILYEGLLRRKKETHGRFEDPYKMVCVCRLQGSVLRVRLTHDGEVVGLEEQFDLSKDWRLMPRNDKPDRFSLNRITSSGDGTNLVTFRAESKDEGAGGFAVCMYLGLCLCVCPVVLGVSLGLCLRAAPRDRRTTRHITLVS